jgi:hypothetical protein
MPEENKIKKEDPKVDLDTSGPEVDVTLPEEKKEEVPEITEQETKEAVVTEVKEQEPETTKEDDSKLEEYSKGVQSRIAKLTRKMREAERREGAAIEYAQALEQQRKQDQSQFKKMDTDYWSRFEKNVKTGMESAQKELASAIEAGDATAQVEANKRIASLAFENAKLEQRQTQPVEPEQPVQQLSDGGRLPQQTPQELPDPDPKAEEWAAKNTWFGKDRAMTFTAFEIHKDLVNEGFDPKSNDYYAEVDKRIKVDFSHKFAKGGDVEHSSKTNQLVASAQRSVKPGRNTVRLTSSQVAIAKKLGVPLEEYERPKVWTPPSSLDAPPAPDGFRHRWIRAESLGFQDSKNISGRLRSGYELVRADEYKDQDYPIIQDGKYKGIIGVGGLVLARVPEEIAKQRTDYYAKQAQGQEEAVEHDLMKEEHKSMPIDVSRQSRVTFGGTKKS